MFLTLPQGSIKTHNDSVLCVRDLSATRQPQTQHRAECATLTGKACLLVSHQVVCEVRLRS